MNPAPGQSVVSDAACIHAWLALETPLERADFVLGFGHFDLRIPRLCVDLMRSGHARRIIFTGGVGAGSADLPAPEAVVFAEEAARIAPDLREDDLLVEPASTNTGDNVRFTLAQAAARGPAWAIDRPGARLMLVATPYRQRRVERTVRLLLPQAVLLNRPPQSTCETDAALFAAKGQDLAALLCGEVERLRTYPDRGWCAPCRIPPEIDAAARRLALRGGV